MKRVLLVFGTRPEAIKMLPLFYEFQKHIEIFETKICVTGQHRAMLDQVLDFFNINADYDLDLMKTNQTLIDLTANILIRSKEVLLDFKPDLVVVHGDTTTAMSFSLSSFYLGFKVAHIEAGLRTYNKFSPFPEEINRNIISKIADFHFAPTGFSQNNLLLEGINSNSICVCGNTVLDALKISTRIIKNRSFSFPNIIFLKKILNFDRDYILVTIHRRENIGDGINNICEAILEIVKKTNLLVVFPVHLNPNVRNIVYNLLQDQESIHLLEPQSYEAFIFLMMKSKIILTDSGGIQEEAPSLKKPVLVLRESTERPEALAAGTVKLVGSNKNKIVDEVLKLHFNEDSYKMMASGKNPYGNGKASQKIVKFLKNKL